MKCKLKVLSPLHIGNGNQLKMVDFYFDENKKQISFIDFDRFFEFCYTNKIDFSNQINNRKYLTGHDFSITKFIDFNKIDLKGLVAYTVPIIIEKRNRQSEFSIKECIKYKGAYIPGSSIKGAIRTALLWNCLNDDRKLYEMFANWIKTDILNNYKIKLKETDNYISGIVFGKDPNSDIMRFLKISDTNQIGMNHLEVSEIKIVGDEQAIPVYVEDLKINTELEFDFFFDSIPEQWKDKAVLESDSCRKYLNTEGICKACNQFSKRVLEKNLTYNWEKFELKEAGNEFYKLWEEINNCKENEAIIHIGWGGGWYSTTIGILTELLPHFTTPFEKDSNNWKLEDNTIRKRLKLGKKPGSDKYSISFPKTRRITVQEKPLGWVKIEILE